MSLTRQYDEHDRMELIQHKMRQGGLEMYKVAVDAVNAD